MYQGFLVMHSQQYMVNRSPCKTFYLETFPTKTVIICCPLAKSMKIMKVEICKK